MTAAARIALSVTLVLTATSAATTTARASGEAGAGRIAALRARAASAATALHARRAAVIERAPKRAVGLDAGASLSFFAGPAVRLGLFHVDDGGTRQLRLRAGIGARLLGFGASARLGVARLPTTQLASGSIERVFGLVPLVGGESASGLGGTKAGYLAVGLGLTAGVDAMIDFSIPLSPAFRSAELRGIDRGLAGVAAANRHLDLADPSDRDAARAATALDRAER